MLFTHVNLSTRLTVPDTEALATVKTKYLFEVPVGHCQAAKQQGTCLARAPSTWGFQHDLKPVTFPVKSWNEIGLHFTWNNMTLPC